MESLIELHYGKTNFQLVNGTDEDDDECKVIQPHLSSPPLIDEYSVTNDMKNF